MSASLEVGDTQQLSAAFLDTFGNTLYGVGVPQWASSNPSVFSVNQVGFGIAIAAGSATLTATFNGIVGSTSVTVTLPAAAQLAADFRVPAQRSLPRVVDLNATNGFAGLPAHGFIYDYVLYRSKHCYVSSPGVWRSSSAYTGGDRMTEFNAGAGASAVMTFNYTGVTPPTPGATMTRVQLPDYTVDVASAFSGEVVPEQDALVPDQDAAIYTRAFVFDIRANTPGDPLTSGKQLNVELRAGTYPGDPVVRSYGSVTVTDDWQSYAFDMTPADIASIATGNRIHVNGPMDATRARDFVVAGMVVAPNRADPVAANRLVPGFWHETLGALSEVATWNAFYPSDDPFVSNGASKVTTAVPAPDSADYQGGNFVQDITLLANRGSAIQTALPVKVTRLSPNHFLTDAGEPDWPLDLDFASNSVAAYAWCSRWFEPSSTGYLPADGELEFELEACLVTSVDVNDVPTSFSETGVKYRGALMRDDAAAPTTRPSDNATFYRARVQVNLGNEHYKWFIPRFQNPTGTDRVVRGTRAAVLPEGVADFRNRGLHDAWVPRRTVTKGDLNGGAFFIIPDISTVVTVASGFWIMRNRMPFTVGQMIPLGIGGRDLWQSGPYGSGEIQFTGAVLPGEDDPTMVRLELGIERGQPGYRGFVINCQIPEGNNIPKWQPWDVALAWQVDGGGATRVIAFGLGLDSGTGLTWYQNGDLLFGQPVSIVETGGTNWGLGDAGDAHCGVGADRDRTGMHGGHVQAIVGGITVSPATIKSQLLYEIQRRWGARV